METEASRLLMLDPSRKIDPMTPKRGKILRLKVGYNPNSSSIGSVVYLFSTKYLVFLSSFGLVTGLIFSFFGRGKRDSKERKECKMGIIFNVRFCLLSVCSNRSANGHHTATHFRL